MTACAAKDQLALAAAQRLSLDPQVLNLDANVI